VTAPATGAITTFTYDSYGRTRTVTDSDSYTLTYDYDALDRNTKVTYPDSTFAETVYNRLDAERRRDRLGRWTHTFHDALRRVVAARDALGRTTTQDWCSCGSLDRLVDANGKATSWERDDQGRTTRVVRPDGSDYVYTYENTTSRLESIEDPEEQLTSITYFLDNSWDEVTYTNTNHSTPTVSFTYDPSYKRLASITDGTGTTAYTYNPVTAPPAPGAARLVSVDGPGTNDVISYSYDEVGRAKSRSINGAALTTTFDALGRLTSEINALGTFTYDYEGVTNRLKDVDYPNGQTTTLSYLGNSQDRRLEEIHNRLPSGTTLSRFEYSYDVAGTTKTWTQQTDTNPEQVYDLDHDAIDQLTTATLRTADQTPTILKRYRYAYDVAENRIGEQIDNASTTSAHNALNALTSVQPGGAMLFAGTVNEAATVTVQQKPAEVTAENRFLGSAATTSGTNTVVVTATDANANTRTNTYEVSLSGSTKTLTYDANGNLTGDGARTFEWDGANRLITIIQGTNRSEFTYDGWGRRVKIVEKENSVVTSDRRFLWCGFTICEERTSAGSVTRRFFTQGMEESGTDFFYATDHLGSVRELTDTSGAVRARYDYDPYGRLTKVSGDKDSVFTFTGHYHHQPSGLALAPFRAYDSTLGRWISQDPMGTVDGLNLFSYVNGRPVDESDPSGLAIPIPIPGPLGLAIGAALLIGGIWWLTQRNPDPPGEPSTPTGPSPPAQPPQTGQPPSSSSPQTPPAPITPPAPTAPPIVEPPSEESSDDECEETWKEKRRFNVDCNAEFDKCLGSGQDCLSCYFECTGNDPSYWPDYKCDPSGW
jgi:RHS repeat-associated protein